jgi:GTPase
MAQRFKPAQSLFGARLKKVAIIGRPNVGKSSLYNALLGYRRTIVSDQAGTTLDKIDEQVTWDGHLVRLSDSQGILEEEDERILSKIAKGSDLLILVVDAKVGVTPYDRWMANVVHRFEKPVLLVVNKDDANDPSVVGEFSELRFSEMAAVSAAHKRNLDLIRDWVSAHAAQDVNINTSLGAPLTITLVGRPNTGKSTLMNRLCEERVSRVSPEALTTRDTVSYEIKTGSGLIRLLDTAGVRRPRSKKGKIELFSINATTRAIRSSDVVFLLIAANEPVADQDARLLSLLVRENKPTIILFNFWDLLSKREQRAFFENSEFTQFLESFSSICVSGKTGYQVDKMFPLAFKLASQSKRRIPTADLNRVVRKIVDKNPPPFAGRGNFNILYASQIAVEPPTIVFFLNRKEALPTSYVKYLENALKKLLKLKGQPIRLYFRGGESRSKGARFFPGASSTSESDVRH